MTTTEAVTYGVFALSTAIFLSALVGACSFGEYQQRQLIRTCIEAGGRPIINTGGANEHLQSCERNR